MPNVLANHLGKQMTCPYTRSMSEKIVTIALRNLHKSGKRSGISWEDIVAHDPTGKLVNLRGYAKNTAMDAAIRKCGLTRRHRSHLYDFMETGATWSRKTRRL